MREKIACGVSKRKACANFHGDGLPHQSTWQSIMNYKALFLISLTINVGVANLRSVGCPQETIRDIIRADVNRLYDGKKSQVRQQAPTREYRKNPEEFAGGAGRETWMKMFELDAERDALLRALGIEPDIRKDEAKRFNEFRSVFLPPYNNVDNPAGLCYEFFHSRIHESARSCLALVAPGRTLGVSSTVG